MLLASSKKFLYLLRAKINFVNKNTKGGINTNKIYGLITYFQLVNTNETKIIAPKINNDNIEVYAIAANFANESSFK